MENNSNPLIYGKIASIMKECPAIGKDQRNSQQGYAYRGIDDVMNALQNLLPKYGVFYVPEVVDAKREERTTAKGGILIYSVLKVKYTFYAEDGSHVSAVVQSEGMDSADKSSNKAMSAACKYALFQVFNIPTKELIDPDATTPEKSVKKTAPQTERSDYPGDEVMLKKFSLPANFKTSMTLEEAESFQSKDGKTYGEMKVQELFELLSSMTDALKRNGLTPSQKENLQNRITAIYLLFDTAKKQGGF